MTIREQWEDWERTFLAPYACLSSQSKGRLREEAFCPIRTVFQVDRDRIIHSKSFRRLKYKTQVLLLPEGDHYRTRLTHTLEVSQIARTIARALRLNEDLTEAISLGHDLGHTPFGHMGERALDELARENGLLGFHHASQSLRVVDVIEKDGAGLNLTEEVRRGILQHSKGQVDVREGFMLEHPSTLEAWVVRVSDSIAYLNHDLDDALRARVIVVEDIPSLVLDRLGRTHGKRIGTLVEDVVHHSDSQKITFSSPILEAVETLRAFLYEFLYDGTKAREEAPKVRHVLRTLFAYFVVNPLLEGSGDPVRFALDFISGMTDRYALNCFSQIAVPTPWPTESFPFTS